MSAACSYCGGPAEAAPATVRAVLRRDLDRAACGSCEALEPGRPGVAVRAAALLLGLDAGDRHLAEALAEDGAVLNGLLYADDALGARPRSARRDPWSHVSPQARASLGRAAARAADLRALDARPAAGASGPPPGPPGCLLCGASSSPSWRPVLTSGLTGGGALVGGHLCAECAEDLAWVGAVGRPLVERAATRALGLAEWEAPRVEGLRAWAATGLPPGEPWAWVTVRDAGPPEPAVRAEVASLEERLARLAAGS